MSAAPRSGALVILLPLITLGACSTPTTSAVEELQDLQSRISSVSLEDGISSSEANTIADVYFVKVVSACGIAHNVTDGGDAWIARTSVGIAALPGEDIHISKATGEVTSAGYPTVADPRTIRVLPPASGRSN